MTPLPPDHVEPNRRGPPPVPGGCVGWARLRLSGFFLPPPPTPVYYDDDTEIALAIVSVLDRHGRIDPDELALDFARRYQADPYRGYGLSVRRVLEQVAEGKPWHASARSIYEGMGSMGNGGAMRVAPLGAYFADDFD